MKGYEMGHCHLPDDLPRHEWSIVRCPSAFDFQTEAQTTGHVSLGTSHDSGVMAAKAAPCARSPLSPESGLTEACRMLGVSHLSLFVLSPDSTRAVFALKACAAPQHHDPSAIS